MEICFCTRVVSISGVPHSVTTRGHPRRPAASPAEVEIFIWGGLRTHIPTEKINSSKLIFFILKRVCLSRSFLHVHFVIMIVRV